MNEIEAAATESFEELLDDMKKDLRKKIKEEYGDAISDSEIEELFAYYIVISTEKKEITTFTKNNYECFHLIIEALLFEETMYVEQYAVFSADKLYTVTISVHDYSELQSSEVADMLESFTINNYKEPSAKKSPVATRTISGIASSLTLLAILGIKERLKKGKEETDTESD